MKKLLIALMILMALVVVVVFYQAGDLMQRGVESYGPKITGTSVTIDDVDVSFLSGAVRIDGLVVGNPQAFKFKNIFTVKTVFVSLDVKSLLSEKIRIKRISIDGVELSYEWVNKSSNMSVLKKNIEKYIESTNDVSSTHNEEESVDGLQVVINDLYIKNTKVNARLAVLDKEKQKSLVLPTLHLQNIGEGSQGDSIAAAVNQVVSLITTAVTKAVTEMKVKELGIEKIKEIFNKKKESFIQKQDDKFNHMVKDFL